MPIGTVDYVSTLPWNDPYNPWPAYSRLTLSATDVDLGAGAMLVYDLTYFNPVVGPSEATWQYTCTTEVSNSTPTLTLTRDNNPGGLFYAEVNTDGDIYYYVEDVTSRNITQGYVQGLATWTESNGENATSLSIMPVTTWLNPWEHRRRWCLNG
jgi:hypothetical protein